MPSSPTPDHTHPGPGPEREPTSKIELAAHLSHYLEYLQQFVDHTVDEVKDKAALIKAKFEELKTKAGVETEVLAPLLTEYKAAFEELKQVEKLAHREKLKLSTQEALALLEEKTGKSKEEEWLYKSVKEASDKLEFDRTEEAENGTFEEKVETDSGEKTLRMGLPVDGLIKWLEHAGGASAPRAKELATFLKSNSVDYWKFRFGGDFNAHTGWTDAREKEQHIWTKREAQLISSPEDPRRTGDEEGDYKAAMKALNERKVLIFDKVPERPRPADAPPPPPPPEPEPPPTPEPGPAADLSKTNRRRELNSALLYEKTKKEHPGWTKEQILADAGVKQAVFAEKDKVKEDCGPLLEGLLKNLSEQKAETAHELEALLLEWSTKIGLEVTELREVFVTMNEELMAEAEKEATKVGGVRKTLRMVTVGGGLALLAAGLTVGLSAIPGVNIAAWSLVGAKGLDAIGTIWKDFIRHGKHTRKEAEALSKELKDAQSEYHKKCLDRFAAMIADRKQQQLDKLGKKKEEEAGSPAVTLKGARDSLAATVRAHAKDKKWNLEGAPEFAAYQTALEANIAKNADMVKESLKARFPSMTEAQLHEHAIAIASLNAEDDLGDIEDLRDSERFAQMGKFKRFLVRGFPDARDPFLKKRFARDVIPGRLGDLGQISLGVGVVVARTVVPGARILDRIGGAIMGRQLFEGAVAGIQKGVGHVYGDVTAADLERVRKMHEAYKAGMRYQTGMSEADAKGMKKTLEPVLDRRMRKGLPQELAQAEVAEKELYATARRQLRDQRWCTLHPAETARLRQEMDLIDRRMVAKSTAATLEAEVGASITDEEKKYAAQLMAIAKKKEVTQLGRGETRGKKKMAWEWARTGAGVVGAGLGAYFGPEVFEWLRDKMQKGLIDWHKDVPPLPPSIPATEMVPPTPHLGYQGGEHVWGEIENQLGHRPGFDKLYDTLPNEGERTWAIDFAKDEIVKNPSLYNVPTGVDIDHLTQEQLRNIDWDKLMTHVMDHKLEAFPHLTPDQVRSIEDNNRLLDKWQATHPGESLESTPGEKNFVNNIIDQMRAEEAAAASHAAGAGTSTESGVGLNYRPEYHAPGAADSGIGIHAPEFRAAMPDFSSTASSNELNAFSADLPKLVEGTSVPHSEALRAVDWGHLVPAQVAGADMGALQHHLHEMQQAIDGYQRLFGEPTLPHDIAVPNAELQRQLFAGNLQVMEHHVREAQDALNAMQQKLGVLNAELAKSGAHFEYRPEGDHHVVKDLKLDPGRPSLPVDRAQELFKLAPDGTAEKAFLGNLISHAGERSTGVFTDQAERVAYMQEHATDVNGYFHKLVDQAIASGKYDADARAGLDALKRMSIVDGLNVLPRQEALIDNVHDWLKGESLDTPAKQAFARHVEALYDARRGN